MKPPNKYQLIVAGMLLVTVLLIGVSTLIERATVPIATSDQETDQAWIPLEYDETTEIDYDRLPSFQLIEAMGSGWNLGSTLDSVDFKKTGINTTLTSTTASRYYETLWGNPITTEDLIAAVADAGFGTVRIPVSFYDHMDDDYNIDPQWLDRIETLVGYVLDNGMYCVINIHHEEKWLKVNLNTIDQDEANLTKVWSQIAEKFKAYDTRLIFEGFNEIRNANGDWDTTNPDDHEALNRLNQTFVDTIRAGAAYNKERFLMVATYAASPKAIAIDPFELPRDTITNHLLISVHIYTPVGFTWTTKEVNWTTVYSDWQEARDGNQILAHFNRLEERFINNGIPVVVGEFAAYNKNNEMDRALYAQFFRKEAAARHMTGFWWDNGGKHADASTIESGTLFNRETEAIYFPDLVDALTQPLE